MDELIHKLANEAHMNLQKIEFLQIPELIVNIGNNYSLSSMRDSRLVSFETRDTLHNALSMRGQSLPKSPMLKETLNFGFAWDVALQGELNQQIQNTILNFAVTALFFNNVVINRFKVCLSDFRSVFATGGTKGLLDANFEFEINHMGQKEVLGVDVLIPEKWINSGIMEEIPGCHLAIINRFKLHSYPQEPSKPIFEKWVREYVGSTTLQKLMSDYNEMCERCWREGVQPPPGFTFRKELPLHEQNGIEYLRYLYEQKGVDFPF